MLLITYNNDSIQGKIFTKEMTLHQPIAIIQTDTRRFYTLVMVDPDAQTPYFLHWLTINIDVEHNTFDEIVSYFPPTPPSGTHRYFFYLLEQPRHIVIAKPKRTWFSLQAFIHNYGLRAVEQVHMKVTAHS